MGFVLRFSIERGGRRARRSILLLAAAGVATLLALPGTAGAQTSDIPSAVDQYVEDVPTGGGSAVPGSGGGSDSNLPPGVSAQISEQGGSDAPLLDQVATSSTYGAPQVERKSKPSGPTISGGMMERREGDGGAAAPETDVSVGSALSSAVSGDEGGRLVGLLVLLLAVSIGALAVSAARHRRRTA
jgi:hypothetical protein